MRCDVRLFEEAQLEEILKEALTVLRRTPFRVQGTDEFLDHLTSYGCEVDGELVRFPQRVIDTVMARCQAIMDMRHGVSRQIGPDMVAHRLAGQEMDDYLYRSEIMSGSRGWGWCGAGAATVSVQSVCEKALGVAFGVATGARAFGVGCLGFSDVGSPAQLVIDCELVQFFQDLFRDVPVDDDHIGVETILETAPKGGRYLESLHTAQFFREACWLPKLLDFRTSMAWDREPSDMIARAREQARDLYARAENRCPLSDVQRTALRQLMRDADAVQG